MTLLGAKTVVFCFCEGWFSFSYRVICIKREFLLQLFHYTFFAKYRAQSIQVASADTPAITWTDEASNRPHKQPPGHHSTVLQRVMMSQGVAGMFVCAFDGGLDVTYSVWKRECSLGVEYSVSIEPRRVPQTVPEQR